MGVNKYCLHFKTFALRYGILKTKDTMPGYHVNLICFSGMLLYFMTQWYDSFKAVKGVVIIF